MVDDGDNDVGYDDDKDDDNDDDDDENGYQLIQDGC